MLKKILRSATHGSTENWVIHRFGRHVVQLWTVPNLLWRTGSLSYGLGLTWVRQTWSFDWRLGSSGIWQTHNWPTILA